METSFKIWVSKMLDSHLKEQIEAAFIAVFNVKGPKVTLEEVATSIHISKKTIYRFFKSKTEIYESILHDTMGVGSGERNIDIPGFVIDQIDGESVGRDEDIKMEIINGRFAF